MIARLESVALEAWPPRSIDRVDGWWLCDGGGFTRRTDSVQPLSPGEWPLAAKIDHAEGFYRERGRRAVFKLTEAAEPAGLDDALAERRYRRADPTSVQTLDLGGMKPDVDAALRIAEPGDEAFLRDCAEIWAMGVERRGALAGMIERIEGLGLPCALVALEEGAGTTAVGLAVITGEHVFLGEIATRPGARRTGRGRRLVDGMLAWGVARGAREALLQVVADNRPAMALYAAMGFVERYRYWYREAPIDRESGPL